MARLRGRSALMADVSPIDTTLGFLQWGIELVMPPFCRCEKWPETWEKLKGLTLPIVKPPKRVTGCRVVRRGATKCHPATDFIRRAGRASGRCGRRATPADSRRGGRRR